MKKYETYLFPRKFSNEDIKLFILYNTGRIIDTEPIQKVRDREHLLEMNIENIERKTIVIKVPLNFSSKDIQVYIQ